ncbi:hypothetical protein GQX74_004510 [Glossina fuscipes]|uniref:Peptidylprolyl isomerase n=1 Tax=Glossina palpalis gambiensis TaxID=67801 RepID=A0A1B0AQA1_9MUSC|nr:hypothetical protein GQX74_004510 [Glossina fuscipes]
MADLLFYIILVLLSLPDIGDNSKISVTLLIFIDLMALFVDVLCAKLLTGDEGVDDAEIALAAIDVKADCDGVEKLLLLLITTDVCTDCVGERVKVKNGETFGRLGEPQSPSNDLVEVVLVVVCETEASLLKLNEDKYDER